MSGSYHKTLLAVYLVFCLFQSAFAYSGGTGEPNDPYKISSVSNWQELMGDSNDWNKHFIMIADVNLYGIALTPVGNSTINFTGVFDGNDHIILSAYINSSSSNYVGVFGTIDGGIIQNLGVEKVKITAKDNVGGLLGLNKRGTINSCYASGIITGTNNTGGLVGRNSSNGIISNCYSMCVVNGSSYIGGLLGYNSIGTINNCYSTGAVNGLMYTGGLLGCNSSSGSISSCYATGVVVGDDSSGSVGGLVGYNSGSVFSSFWDKLTSGKTSSSGGRGLATNQMKSVITYQNAGWADKGWVINNGLDYPRLSWENTIGVSIPGPQPIPLSGDGSEENPYQVWTPNDFVILSWHIGILDKHIVLMTDLDMSGLILYPIGDLGTFIGIFDGNNHKITYFTINFENGSYLGLFSRIGYGGQIKNLGLENFSVSSFYGSNIGALAGENTGSISSCYAIGTVTDGKYSDYIGGLVGKNMGSISSCYTIVVVTCGEQSAFSGGLVGDNRGSISSCYTAGAVVCDDYAGNVGGLAGQNYGGSISNCNSIGEISGYSNVGGLVGYNYNGGSISNCYYSTDTVSGNTDVGGLVGHNQLSSISNCHSTGEVGGYKNVGGLVGLNDDDGIIGDCNSMCDVSGFTGVGGLIGMNYHNISFCYATGKVTGTGGSIGGLVGWTGAIFDHCYATGAVSGYIYVGGLVGMNYSTSGNINNCYSTGPVSGSSNSQYIGGLIGRGGNNISDCYHSIGDVSGYQYVGGLIGECTGGIATNCYSECAVNGYSSSQYIGGLMGYCSGTGQIVCCYSIGIVSGTSYVGGLAGYKTGGSIINCYSMCPVSGTTYIGGLVGYNNFNISNSYSTGSVYGSSNSGGLVGYYNGSGNITGSFWDVNSSGWTTSSGGTGKTTEEMKTLSTFTSAGWDFTTPTWKICDGTNYPKLAWQKPLSGDFICPDGVGLEDLLIFCQQWLLEKLPADIVSDGIVNFLDWSVFANSWQHNMNDLADFSSQWLKSSAYCADIDPLGDNVVNFIDFALFANNWLKEQ
jgi:hypothetical protein